MHVGWIGVDGIIIIIIIIIIIMVEVRR